MEQILLGGLGSGDVALLLLRLVVGAGSFVHGKGKVTAIHLFEADHHLPRWLAWVAAIAQFAGGICFVLGLFTSVAAIALVIFYLYATYVLIVHKKEPFAAPGKHSWDSGLLYLVVPLAILFAGPGRFSLDRLLLG